MATKRKKTLAELMQERAQQSTDTSAYTTNPMPRANLNNDTWNRVINRRNAILNDTEMFVRNTGLGAKSGVVSALGQTEFLTQQKNEAYRKFREADTQLRNIDKNLSVEEKLKKENEKLEKTKNVNGIIVTKRPEIKDSAIMQDFAKEQEEINKKIAENTEKTKTKLGKFYAGNVAPSMGQSLTGTALDIMAPGMGSGYRLLSYSGNYTQDALNSGMKEKESAMYGLTMGAVESAMDAVGDKLKGKLIGEGKTAKGLKEFLEIGAEELGVNSFVEGIGEALTEPLQEKAKELYGGKADYNNILQRMGQSFVSGVASELLMSGASLGYSGSINVINKIQNGEQVSTNEISDALKEINEKEEIDITKILANQFELTSQDLYINKDVQQKTNTKLENMAQDISKGEFKGIKNNSLIEDSGLDKEEKKILTEITQKYNLSEENVKKLIEKTENGWFYKNQPTTIENKPISKQTQQVISNEGKMAENGMSQETSNIGQNVQKTTENTKNNKQKQFEIIQKTNPMQDDYHVGIRNVEDIKTFEEAIQDDESFVWGDYSEEDAKRDLQKGTVTVYSSKPIEDGVFVSTSKNQAQDYAGSGKVYSQEVSIDDVAWINGDEGQFAKIETPNIENNQQTMYNDFESEGVLNGKQNVNKGRNDEIWNREIEEGSENTRKYTDEEYDNWERNIKPISEEKLTDSEKEIIKKAKNDYNKEVRLYDENENDNTYAGGASRIVKGRINISRQEAEATGLNFMIDHENVESDILYNDTALDLLEPIIDAIMQDNNFDNQMVEFWKDQKGNRPKDSLIAKDIICDRFAERNQQQETKYKNVLSQETNQIIDRALDSYYYQVYGKELQDFKYNTKDSTESSFSMQKNVREDGLLDARTETTTKNVKKKTLNPTEISNLTMEDASSTPKLIGKKKARGNKQSNFLKNITVKSRFLNQDFRNELTEEDNIRYYNGISNIDTLNMFDR